MRRRLHPFSCGAGEFSTSLSGFLPCLKSEQTGIVADTPLTSQCTATKVGLLRLEDWALLGTWALGFHVNSNSKNASFSKSTYSVFLSIFFHFYPFIPLLMSWFWKEGVGQPIGFWEPGAGVFTSRKHIIKSWPGYAATTAKENQATKLWQFWGQSQNLGLGLSVLLPHPGYLAKPHSRTRLDSHSYAIYYRRKKKWKCKKIFCGQQILA